MRPGWRRWTSAAALLIAAAFLVVHALRQFTISEVVQPLPRVSTQRRLLAALYTGASYLTLTWFDRLGILHAGRKLLYRRVALASFVSLSIGHTVGFAPFSTGAIRYR